MYVAVLVGIVGSALLIIGLRGFGSYSAPEEERPFHAQYNSLKPTGFEGHGYGIIGTALLIAGVANYSARKRVRFLSNIGKVKHFLEFHIFLCVLGPILVTYHTTFKIGGLVAVSYWCMVAVVASGVIGRYLYVQIPKGIQGNELSADELAQRGTRIFELLQKAYGVELNLIRTLDSFATPPIKPSEMSLWDVASFFVVNGTTGELKLDYGKGLLVIDAPRAQGASGNLKAAGRLELAALSVSSDLDLAHIIAVALDGQPLATSRRILVQGMSEERASGFETEASSTSVKKITNWPRSLAGEELSRHRILQTPRCGATQGDRHGF